MGHNTSRGLQALSNFTHSGTRGGAPADLTIADAPRYELSPIALGYCDLGQIELGPEGKRNLVYNRDLNGNVTKSLCL